MAPLLWTLFVILLSNFIISSSIHLLHSQTHQIALMGRNHSPFAIIVLLLLLFSHYILFDSPQPHGLQHANLLCPPLSPGVCSD